MRLTNLDRKQRIFKHLLIIAKLLGHDPYVDAPVCVAVCKKCGKAMNIDIDFGTMYLELIQKECPNIRRENGNKVG